MWKVFFCAAIAFPTYNAGKNALFVTSTSEFFHISLVINADQKSFYRILLSIFYV